MKKVVKNALRWFIFGGTLFFLGKALKDNWLEVSSIRIDAAGWATLTIATGVTLLAHTWAGWIWTWILKEFNQSVSTFEFIQVYLKTNIAKYLPGNVWHYYGRILAAKNANISTVTATLSVLLEPLLMAAAALITVVLFGSQLAVNNTNIWVQILQFLSLIVLLGAVHPWVLNSIIRFLYRLKNQNKNQNSTSENQSINGLSLDRYPLLPLLGELIFLGLRGTGFILTMYALFSVKLSQIPLLFGAFSFAWVLGLVVPGAPGGLGVFEATAIALLQHRFPAALVISAIALYRLISILAETAGAALASLDERFYS
ncbi:lysylphosphatidylglycerol synthase transmembrane domain-containing protein [Sphaerospermopsis torques-reginae]|uniref:Lysylphosphatidylglycerol synthase domain-containing protein n=1 Tax=Sphaerospermopsis torques-reginae ITEP-024 TaxID=984208 RepID=A0ABX8X5M6_9CYAN|nr:YbhN family protein [Sphaerospermopsis torques-reginae]QYX33817.1 lysylphosphatidylglycerol synthase domain-containing protein [Sphaerospermopsis torques-reginae ITEP-024]